MNWPAYAEYKNSDIEWLKDVPSHWSVDRLKWSVESSQNGVWGNETDGGPDDIRCVRVADFDRPRLRIQDRDITFRKVSESERNGRLLSQGDLILEKSGGGEKNPVGFVVLYDRSAPAVTSNFVARVTLRVGMEPRFWTYLHHWLYASRLTLPSIKQTSGIQNLDQQSYFDERVCFPPPIEQSTIADFLDSETEKIDALIVKQEQLIATLREDRTATITLAVTKGLNPHVEMNDSGVEWVGDIPAHWDFRAIAAGSHLVQTGPFGSQLHATDYVHGGVPIVNPSHISDRSINPQSKQTVSDEKAAELTRHRLRRGDVIAARRGELGRCAVVTKSSGEGYLCGTGSLIIRLDTDRFTPNYFQYFFSSSANRERLSQISEGSTMDNLNAEMISRLRVCRPPISEQHQIAAFLDERCAKIDRLIEKTTTAIETLSEFRSALITAAVTGKIDVRGAA